MTDSAAPKGRQADFGFESVPWQEKKSRVHAVFDSVADRYDLMNDLMSLGLHRLWKRFALLHTGLRPGRRALDLAAGSGDLSIGLARQVGLQGLVAVSDINARMLARGRDRLLDAGQVSNVRYVVADAEQLPFPSRFFDCVTIGFGLRNVTDKAAALAEMYRVLRPGGRALVLEFSKLTFEALVPLYDFYSLRVLPRLGRLVVDDEASYRYLAESIRRHPDQGELEALMQARGFERCRYHNLTGGIVALHVGYRL
ncbi:MAG TPA: bifunctional demethylmenaquinone methyltransferase/2-methoxy-6-polyprenyl-1,4-benzoquinol methylase UbiE [Gammaproteobacteria bacterium]|nr:bifunctional demethylmenaquinone methyltransferase/2-methoxy-6-polyprenyl-1,4-benzoquinol methylase UbiE [Gammaproteobacteria bacterium]